LAQNQTLTTSKKKVTSGVRLVYDSSAVTHAALEPAYQWQVDCM